MWSGLCCETARLQEKATESVTDLVGVFKYPHPCIEESNSHTPSKIIEEDWSIKKSENVVAAPVSQQRAGTALCCASQSSQPDGIQHASTEKFPKSKSESKFANVLEGVSHGGAGQRRHRRSSGFLSLLGYIHFPKTFFF
jgi:hypothetical protein